MRPVRAQPTAMIAALAFAGVLALAGPAGAEPNPPPAPVTGWSSSTPFCGGAISLFPVIVTNTTTEVRVGSYTVPNSIIDQVQISNSPSNFTCAPSSRGAWGYYAQEDFTVQPGQSAVLWLAVGSVSNQSSAGSHNMALGGLPSGTRGQSWYDLGVTLNNAVTGLNGGNTFNNITVTYQGTGGLDPNTNGQNLFNIVGCNVSNGNIYPDGQLLTPYNAGQWTQGPTYRLNAPICAAWLPPGTFSPFTNAGTPNFTVLAAQFYKQGGNGAQVLAIAGSSPTNTPITSMAVSWSGSAIGTQTLTTTPSPNGWWGQDPVTGDWFISGLVPVNGGATAVASVIINGTTVGTANF